MYESNSKEKNSRYGADTGPRGRTPVTARTRVQEEEPPSRAGPRWWSISECSFSEISIGTNGILEEGSLILFGMERSCVTKKIPKRTLLTDNSDVAANLLTRK